MTILVIGATGKTGRAVVDALTARGVKVAAASRTPETVEAATHDAGPVRAVRFDWADRATWAPALEGAEGLYVVGPTAHPTGEVLVGELLAEAADVRRVALLSVIGADRLPPEVMMADWERDVRAAGAAGKEWTILRPNWFIQNFGNAFAAPLRDKGVLELPAADAALSFVDTRDVAEVAAAALTEDGHAGRIYDITGPESLTYAEALKTIAAAAGRDLTYRAISHEQAAENLRAAGVRERAITWQRGLYDLIIDGANAAVTPVVQQVTGHPARNLAQYAAEHAATWR